MEAVDLKTGGIRNAQVPKHEDDERGASIEQWRVAVDEFGESDQFQDWARRGSRRSRSSRADYPQQRIGLGRSTDEAL